MYIPFVPVIYVCGPIRTAFPLSMIFPGRGFFNENRPALFVPPFRCRFLPSLVLIAVSIVKLIRILKIYRIDRTNTFNVSMENSKSKGFYWKIKKILFERVSVQWYKYCLTLFSEIIFIIYIYTNIWSIKYETDRFITKINHIKKNYLLFLLTLKIRPSSWKYQYFDIRKLLSTILIRAETHKYFQYLTFNTPCSRSV